MKEFWLLSCSLKILSEPFLSGPNESQTWTQPFRLSPSVTRSDWGKDYFGGIHIDFQAGELVSPATKLYIHFKRSHDMRHSQIMTHRPRPNIVRLR